MTARSNNAVWNAPPMSRWVEQEVGELGHRKHEDEVEKELHGGDPMVALAVAA